MSYGITDEGFVAKTLEVIRTELEQEVRAAFGDDTNTSSASAMGQLIGIFATKMREVWELAEAAYDGGYPDSATERSLTLLAALTGTQRRAATKSTVECTVNVNPGTYAPGDLIASVFGYPDRRFVNIDSVTNGGVSADDIEDITFECEEAGVVLANAGTLTVIAQSVVGWNSITNPEDAAAGEVEESDADLRTRRELELAASGSTTADAIRADILREVEGVISCTVLENDTDETDGNGVPPHSFECIVLGPDGYDADDDQAVADQIWDSKPTGIRAYGTTSKTVTDSQGFTHAVAFTRPTDKNVYLRFDLTVNEDWVGSAAFKEAIVAFGDANYAGGDDVVRARLIAAAFASSGVVDVTDMYLAFTASPVATSNLTIALREIARLDTARITVLL